MTLTMPPPVAPESMISVRDSEFLASCQRSDNLIQTIDV